VWLAANLNCIPARPAHRQKATLLSPLARHGTLAMAATAGAAARASKGSGRCPTRAFLCEGRRPPSPPPPPSACSDFCVRVVCSRRACLGCPRGYSVCISRPHRERSNHTRLPSASRCQRPRLDTQQTGPSTPPTPARPCAGRCLPVACGRCWVFLEADAVSRNALAPNRAGRRLTCGCVNLPNRQPWQPPR
jgi:hypothetical protein